MKKNKILLIIFFLIIILSIILIGVFIFLPRGEQTSDKASNHTKTTTDYSIKRVVCYSSGYGVNNEETQARWNLNLSQYTDIGIYLNLEKEITSLFIDNISFSNTDGNTYFLISLPIEDFGKTPTSDIEIQPTDRIELDTNSPITLRYLNQNFTKNHIITDTENPLVFDGSLLKRGKITLSSLKNTVSFIIHLTDAFGKSFSYPMEITIPLENQETGETIYDGNYMEENFPTDAYFSY